MAPQGIVIRLNDALLFSSGRANLDDHALNAGRRRSSAIIKPLPNQIRIEGNTDDQPPEGVPLRRATGISRPPAPLRCSRRWSSMGMPPDRLSAQGNAQYNPIVPNTDDASRAKNRRVDIVVIYPPAGRSVGQPDRAALIPMSSIWRRSGQPPSSSRWRTAVKLPIPRGRRAILVLGVPLGLAAAGALALHSVVGRPRQCHPRPDPSPGQLGPMLALDAGSSTSPTDHARRLQVRQDRPDDRAAADGGSFYNLHGADRTKEETTELALHTQQVPLLIDAVGSVVSAHDSSTLTTPDGRARSRPSCWPRAKKILGDGRRHRCLLHRPRDAVGEPHRCCRRPKSMRSWERWPTARWRPRISRRR